MSELGLVLVVLAFLALGCGLFLLMRQRVQRRQRELRVSQRDLVEQGLATVLDLLKRQNWSDAVATVDAVLALAAIYDPSRQAELYYYKGYALEQMKQLEQAAQAYQKCQIAEVGQAERKYFRHAAFRHGYLLTQLQRWDEAAEKLQSVIAEARRFPMPELQLTTLRILLGVYRAKGDHARALSCAQEGLRLARNAMNEAMMALFLDLAGDAYLSLGQPEEALHHYEQSLDLYRKLGHTNAALMVEQDIGRLYQACAELDKALEWFHTCLWAEQRLQNKRGQAQHCYDIACHYMSAEQLDKAAEYLQQSIALFRQAQDKSGVDQVGRALMGLSIMMQRRATAGQMTFRDIERATAKGKKEEEK
nr:tetratricopeptide repeat protein [Chloroflexota bacterium]